jgi:2-desacetyl-2-hydroxyethyl bacteriochlorophyllide A dehydrogenase
MKEKMQGAVFYGKNKLKLETRDVPEIKSDELLIEVKACGICGTDVRRHQGAMSFNSHITGNIAGHEITGIIKQKGEEVRHHTVGERVVVFPLHTCGICHYCNEGNENLCINAFCVGEEKDGGYAQYTVVNQKQTFTLPDNIEFDEGILLADPVPTSFHAITRRANIQPGDLVAIWGTGPQGLIAVQLAKFYKGNVLLIGRNEKKLALARKMGADQIINCQNTDVVREVKASSNDGADVCLECGGYAGALEQAVACVKKGGRVVQVGLQKSPKIDFEEIVFDEKQLLASFSATYQECKMGIDLAKQGKLTLKPLITHRFILADIDKAFELLSNRKEYVIQAVINP